MRRGRIFLSMMILVLFSCRAVEGQNIVYDLPKSVTSDVKVYIDKYKNGEKFIAQLSKQSDDRYTLFVINYDFAGLDSFKLIEETLIKRTSRVVRVGSIELPLITDEDLLFADFGTEKMKDGREAKKRVVFNSESYAISFDRSGKLYK